MDKRWTQDLVERYIAETDAILLAAGCAESTTAENYLPNQADIQLVKDYLAAIKNMDILSKVDRLMSSSEEDTAAKNLVLNGDPSMSLGHR